jgi:cytochrome c peroxidase
MKKVILVIIISLFCFFTISSSKSEVYVGVSPTVSVTSDYYLLYFNNFQSELENLVILTEKVTTNETIDNLREQLINTRLAYKKIEFLFDYYNPSYNYAFINGRPLPKFSERFGGGKILEPKGLQTLDEHLFDDEAIKSLPEIKELVQELEERVAYIKKIQFPSNLKENQIIEAIRSGMVRVFTLGLTGFDTPGCKNALEESYNSFKSMETVFLYFEATLNQNGKQKYAEIKKLFKKGAKTLKKTSNFNEFDRLTFLKETINPLYSNLLEFQNLNKIKVNKFKFHAQNYKADNLFAEDFLNTDFYSEFVYLPLENPRTVALGKLLFEDPQLSKGGEMSCVSCHDANKGFGDGLPKSKTNKEDVFTQRNSPSIINAGYSTRYFWDMREYNLEKQVAHVIESDVEFNTTFPEIERKLNRKPKYRKLFNEAYGGISKKDINSRSISNAIAAYVNSLKSFNSDFDKYVRNQTANYPEAAKRGFNLFMGKGACGTCHFAPMFNGTVPPFYTESESEVLGVTMGLDTINPIKDSDPGRMANGLMVDKYPFFENSFKTVTVRNIAVTAPYMHNGTFNTLEDVMEFYNH